MDFRGCYNSKSVWWKWIPLPCRLFSSFKRKNSWSANVACVLGQMDSPATRFVSVCCGFGDVSHVHVASKPQPFLFTPTAASTLQHSRALGGRGFGNLCWPRFNPNSPAEEGSLCCCTRAPTQLAPVFRLKKKKKLHKTNGTKDFKSLRLRIMTYCYPGVSLSWKCLSLISKSHFFFSPFRQLRPPPLKPIIFFTAFSTTFVVLPGKKKKKKRLKIG